jgi:hypothetical protein
VVTKPAAVGADLLTLDDVSEHNSQSFDSDGAGGGTAAKADTVPSPTAAGAYATSPSYKGHTAAVAPAPALDPKSVDAGLYTIIRDMVTAIEVAVWDAAMRH